MTLEQLKAKYDEEIEKIGKSIEFYRKYDPKGHNKVVGFYEGRLWVFKRFRRELEELET